MSFFSSPEAAHVSRIGCILYSKMARSGALFAGAFVGLALSLEVLL